MVAATAGSYGASNIGGLYGDEAIGYWNHKILHAGLGAATGALLSWDDPWVGAACGAAAAMFIPPFSPKSDKSDKFLRF